MAQVDPKPWQIIVLETQIGCFCEGTDHQLIEMFEMGAIHI